MSVRQLIVIWLDAVQADGVRREWFCDQSKADRRQDELDDQGWPPHSGGVLCVPATSRGMAKILDYLESHPPGPPDPLLRPVKMRSRARRGVAARVVRRKRRIAFLKEQRLGGP